MNLLPTVGVLIERFSYKQEEFSLILGTIYCHCSPHLSPCLSFVIYHLYCGNVSNICLVSVVNLDCYFSFNNNFKFDHRYLVFIYVFS